MDGSIMWDLYSLAAIAIECDMAAEEYKRVKDERQGKQAINKHLEHKGTCKRLGDLAGMIVLDYNSFDEPTL